MLSGKKGVYLPSLNGTYRYVDEKFLLIKRNLLLKKTITYQEVVGPNYFLSRFQGRDGAVGCRVNGGVEHAGEDKVFWQPAYSLPEFYIYERESISVEILVCKDNCYLGMPNYPCIINNKELLNIVDFSKKLLTNGVSGVIRKLVYDDEISALAFNTKQFLDCNYMQPFLIRDVAKKMKTSSAVLSRYFMRAYHMSPIRYLNELRAKESMGHLLNLNKTVKETSKILGFNNQKQLYENFKKFFSSPPSSLQR